MNAVTPAIKTAIAGAMKLIPPALNTDAALVMLYAIGLQESGFKLRRQMGNGPARGLWQFEQGGGVKGVCQHDASRFWMSKLCEVRKVSFTPADVYNRLEFDDILAAGAARLLLFTDPKTLPGIGDQESAWKLYLRVWRPGKPKPDTWPANYASAMNNIGVPA